MKCHVSVKKRLNTLTRFSYRDTGGTWVAKGAAEHKKRSWRNLTPPEKCYFRNKALIVSLVQAFGAESILHFVLTLPPQANATNYEFVCSCWRKLTRELRDSTTIQAWVRVMEMHKNGCFHIHFLVMFYRPIGRHAEIYAECKLGRYGRLPLSARAFQISLFRAACRAGFGRTSCTTSKYKGSSAAAKYLLKQMRSSSGSKARRPRNLRGKRLVESWPRANSRNRCDGT
jgi:hypothetical protein